MLSHAATPATPGQLGGGRTWHRKRPQRTGWGPPPARPPSLPVARFLDLSASGSNHPTTDVEIVHLALTRDRGAYVS